jgi:lysophospholipase L1-like esterase
MGSNDVGWPKSVLDPGAMVPTPEAVIDGYRQLILRAHLHGLWIVCATLTPFEDAYQGRPLEGFYSPEKEEVRLAVNSWIRNSGAFDGVIDFDAVIRDPNRPSHLQATFDSGDHLHPNDAGYEAMGSAIDLKTLSNHR